MSLTSEPKPTDSQRIIFVCQTGSQQDANTNVAYHTVSLTFKPSELVLEPPSAEGETFSDLGFKTEVETEYYRTDAETCLEMNMVGPPEYSCTGDLGGILERFAMTRPRTSSVGDPYAYVYLSNQGINVLTQFPWKYFEKGSEVPLEFPRGGFQNSLLGEGEKPLTGTQLAFVGFAVTYLGLVRTVEAIRQDRISKYAS